MWRNRIASTLLSINSRKALAKPGFNRQFAEAARDALHLAGSCLLERLPVVTPEDLDWEVEYHDYQKQLLDRYRKELPKEFHEDEASKADAAALSWQPAPRVTKADEANDTRSLDRKLERRLYLLLKKRGANDEWELPTMPYNGEEAMRDTAEIALNMSVTGDPSWKVFFIGNAPCAHFTAHQSRTFIHKAQLINGAVKLLPDSRYSDYAWLSREEVLGRTPDPIVNELFVHLLPRRV